MVSPINAAAHDHGPRRSRSPVGPMVREGLGRVRVVKPPKPRLPDQVRRTIRAKHYSRRAERAYVDWIRRFILFHKKQHPLKMGRSESSSLLTHFAVRLGTGSGSPSALSGIIRHPHQGQIDGS
jgi:hypothetical protein